MRIGAALAKALRAPGRRLRTWRTLNTDTARRIAASGLFDEPWYLNRYPDVSRRGYPALVHFIRSGAAEGRDPNPFFQTEWYRRHNPGIGADVNPLVHYIAQGGSSPPSPGFDPAWYRAEHPGLGER